MAIVCFNLLLALSLALVSLHPSGAARILGAIHYKELNPKISLLNHHLHQVDDIKVSVAIQSNEKSELVITDGKRRCRDEGCEDEDDRKKNEVGKVGILEAGNESEKRKSHRSRISTKRKKLSATFPWRIPRHKKQKQQGRLPRDPEINLDYTPPRVHPPSHN